MMIHDTSIIEKFNYLNWYIRTAYLPLEAHNWGTTFNSLIVAIADFSQMQIILPFLNCWADQDKISQTHNVGILLTKFECCNGIVYTEAI